ncbi:hypothetical protein L2E82_20863 [Cichorium intybus]|uniref:Uncharacterized protein n=1 Tax=Cichorium intybus TaxID=13427 RepID=A0ACB9DUU4_CICIN|nr:hypothetical protein L2E82_20863 [Cichorium intybus]
MGIEANKYIYVENRRNSPLYIDFMAFLDQTCIDQFIVCGLKRATLCLQDIPNLFTASSDRFCHLRHGSAGACGAAVACFFTIEMLLKMVSAGVGVEKRNTSIHKILNIDI